MNYSKDCFHRFKSYMDNMNIPKNKRPNNRQIPKITFPQIMGEDIMNELLKAKSTDTVASTETVQDVSESVVNPDVSTPVDLTNMHTGLEESSPEITSICVDSVSDAKEPGATPEPNSGATTHGNQPECTNSANSEEDTPGVHETNTPPHIGSQIIQPKCVDAVSDVTASEETVDPSNVDLSKSADTVLSTKTASDLNKSDMGETSADGSHSSTGNNKRKATGITDTVSPKARRQQLQKEDTNDRFYCQNCSSDYKNRKELLRHQRRVCGKEQGSFKCGVCETFYYHKESLQDHLGKVHTREKRHKCKFCSEEFFYRRQLNAHVKNQHQSQ